VLKPLSHLSNNKTKFRRIQLEFPHKRGGLHLCGYTPNINLGSNKITGIISHPQANTLDRKCRSNAQMSDGVV